jgi:WD40 repeat protein
LDTRTGIPIATLSGKAAQVDAVVASPKGLLAASWSIAEPVVYVWDVATKVIVSTIKMHCCPTLVAFDSLCMHLVVIATDDTASVRVFDLENGRQQGVLKGSGSPVWSVAFSSCSRQFATGYQDGTIRIWDWPARTQVAVFREDQHAIDGLAFSSDDKRVLSSSRDGTMREWRVIDGVCLQCRPGHGIGPSAITGFASEHPFIMVQGVPEAKVLSTHDGTTSAFYQIPLGSIVPHPSGLLWGGQHHGCAHLIRIERGASRDSR